jgi:hypothetical protein
MPKMIENIPQYKRKEQSIYKPTDLWTEEDDLLFLKYCPNTRDRCYHTISRDTSCRPHEILTGTGKIVENWQPKPQPTAEQSYRRAMRGLTKAWKGSTGYDKLPRPGEDVLLDYIKPSEEHWIRILKGLDGIPN